MRGPRVVRASGALVEVAPVSGVSLFELVRVGERSLMGEIVSVERRRATVQVYEETSGLRVGEPVQLTGMSLAANLGPGLLGSVLDGVGRPLTRLAERSGAFIEPGTNAATLDPEHTWTFASSCEETAEVS
ncbi:MAG TPA: V-type ATP synthase subunit A, partial [Thermoanaerobaculia bacterium]|nr:V-type ATP synthase subunit A [Thermoanaerobaculia bacterium]